MKTPQRLYRDSSRNISPYSPVEPPDQIAKRLNIPEESIIKLDANENPFGTSKEVVERLGNGKYYHIYPDPAQVQLRESIATYVKGDPDSIVVGTGADELIDIVCRLLIDPGDKVIGFSPTFSYYPHIINLNSGVYETHRREKDFSISLEKVKKLDLENVKLVILCSPNNPSGNLLEEEVLDYFLNRDVIVMLDEAYYEFSGVSYLEKLRSFNNLIVLRTFSKCFGLAGLRVGYCVTSNEIARELMRIKPPFSVNVAAEIAVKDCVRNIAFYRRQVDQLIEIRQWTQTRLERFRQLKVFPSRSNFILCQVSDFDAKALRDKLEQQGVLVRYFDTELLRNYIRVSMGTQRQMSLFLEKLENILN